MTNSFNFLKENTNWQGIKATLFSQVDKFIREAKKDFTVEIKEYEKKKTYPQLKGIHKLCNLLAIRLTECNGIKYDTESAKLWVKIEFGYIRKANEVECTVEALNEKNRKLINGEKMNKKEFIDLIEHFKKDLKKPKSFKDATKDELCYLITKMEELGARMSWNELHLTSHEMQEFNKYWEINEHILL